MTRLCENFNHDGKAAVSLPAASAAFFAAMSIWWSNENCLMDVKGHPSPIPNTVDSSKKYEEFEKSELDMNRLPVYTR